MLKRIICTIVLIAVLLTIAGCSSSEKSAYDSLTDSQKEIVDTVLSNNSKFSDCNGIRFSTYNGKTYFVVSSTEFSNNPNSLGGYVSETRFYVVDDGLFYEEPYDTYASQTQYGGITTWDGSWDIDTKRETLAQAIN